jgi:hypothetical protein
MPISLGEVEATLRLRDGHRARIVTQRAGGDRLG